MTSTYNNLISIENLFQAWEEFRKGKRGKKDVLVFERHLEDNVFELQKKLARKTYKHGIYSEFYVNDPKRRHIHKAEVADRIVHHLLYKYLYSFFDKTFIHDSYSCRFNKGTHRAVRRLERYTRIVSKNYTKGCWVLKLDIKKFFVSIDHIVLKRLIAKRVKDEDILWLIDQVIDSFNFKLRVEPGDRVEPEKGIPLGNLTSQIFANIYLNELDQFIKHKLKIKYYLRYADDFVILVDNKDQLISYIETLESFLRRDLKLELHPKKVILRRFSWGIDFCGYVVLSHYILPRTKTKRRIFGRILEGNASGQSLQSYLGYFSHASAYDVEQSLKNLFYFKTATLDPLIHYNSLRICAPL